MIISIISRQNLHYHHLQLHLHHHLLPHFSTLTSKYTFTPPSSLLPQNPNPNPKNAPPKKPPFDFHYSNTQNNLSVKPIGLCGPKYTPFGPARLDPEWAGVSAPVNSRRVLHNPNPNPNPKNSPHNPNPNPKNSSPKKPQYRPPSSLKPDSKPLQSKLPFDFRYSYTESNPSVKPIGLRGPKYSPFGPGRLAREWTGVCAPVKSWKVRSVDGDVEDCDLKLKERRKVMRESILGKPLTDAERKILVDKCQRGKTKRQINLGRDGLTHNMLNDVHNHWKHDEAIRIKCMGVSSIDMENVCIQIEDKTYGKIIHRHGGLLVLYRGRKYKPKKRPVIPLMLWKPQEPVYPKLIKTTIEGLSIEETKEMRKRGLAVPALTKLVRNGYYGNLVPIVRDAFLVEEMVRIDCTGLDKSDRKKIGVKLRDLVPCIPVTFAKEQIVVWRGRNYEPPEDKLVLTERDPSEISIDNMVWDS